MKYLVAFLSSSLLLVPNAFGGLTVGVATDVTPVTASGTLNSVGWTATTTASSPFVGINLPSGTWDLGTAIPSDALFLAAGDVNAGDTQTFVFDQPVNDILFYVENFDSNSAANIVSDGNIALVSATADITFTPATSTSATLATTNAGFDGVGDAILQFSGPTSYIQFDFTNGIGANGVFYGFAGNQNSINVTPVPEPSAFMALALCGVGIAYVRRRKFVG